MVVASFFMPIIVGFYCNYVALWFVVISPNNQSALFIVYIEKYYIALINCDKAGRSNFHSMFMGKFPLDLM